MIGVAFDGTGYGTDGAVWGGEVLVADYKSFRRAAHLALRAAGRWRRQRAAARTGWRWRTCAPPASTGTDDLPPRGGLPRRPSAPCSPTSSTPASAACRPPAWAGSSTRSPPWPGSGTRSTSRPRPPSSSKALARPEPAGGAVRLRPGASPTSPVLADPGTGRSARSSRTSRAGVPAGRGGGSVPRRRSPTWSPSSPSAPARTTGLDVVALGGGVFQNALLLDGRPRGCCESAGFTVLRPRLLPPNDGGIALGQIVIGSCG